MKPDDSGKSLAGLAALFVGLLFAAIVFLSDRATFVRPPGNFLEKLASIPAIGIFECFGDRLLAAVSAGVVWLGFVLVLAGLAWRWILRRLLEPLRIRRFVDAKRREKQWLNRLDDDTL